METGERVELAWHGPNHSPDNTYILFPDHDTLMFIDVVNAGWIPIYNLNLSDDVIGYTGPRHRTPGPGGDPPGRRAAPAVHRRHRGQLTRGAGSVNPGTHSRLSSGPSS